MNRRRDPWAPFRIWTAFSLAFYALRASFATTWMGAVPGYVLVWLVLIAIALAASALLVPARVVPIRQRETAWWANLRDDWNHWWHRHLGHGPQGPNPKAASTKGASSQRRQGP